MISSIFGKTKPVNFVILLSFILFFYPLANLYVLNRDIFQDHLIKEVVVLVVLLFSVFLMDFIVKRNKLTKDNSYAIFLFTLLLIAFPKTLADANAILCMFFLLMATRRILSIKSLKNIKLKIFDASLWILVATLFYDWAILYMVLVLSAIFIYEPKNLRNWLAILSSAVCFILILGGILFLFGRTDFLREHYTFYLDYPRMFNLRRVTSPKLVIYLVLNGILIFWAFLKLGKGGVGRIVMIRMVVLSFGLGLLINLLLVYEDTFALIITFFPSVVLATNYIQSIKREKIREIALVTSVLLAVGSFLSSLLVSY